MADQEPQDQDSHSQDSAAAEPQARVDLTLSASAMKALAHPLRQAMHQYIVDHGPSTATTLAKALGESTGQTSYHLRQLAKHGMIVESETHKGKGKERWWEAVGLRADAREIDDPESLMSLRSIAAAQVRNHAEYMFRWINTMTPGRLQGLKGVEMSRTTARLTPEEADALIGEIARVVDEHTDRAKARIDAEGEGDARRMRIYLDVVPLEFGTEPEAASSE